MNILNALSFQRKLLIFIMAMVLFMGGTMGLLIRLVIFPYLDREIEARGYLSARKLAENIRSLILVRDKANLTAMLFAEKQMEPSIAYIVVTDAENRLLAHTFLGTVPQSYLAQQPKPDGAAPNSPVPDAPDGARLTSVDGKARAGLRPNEIVVPVHEGLYQIGTVRIGQDEEYFTGVIRKFSLYHLGFTGFITLTGFLFGLYISKVVTKPITALTTVAREIGRGNLNARIRLGKRDRCRDILDCKRNDCPAYNNASLRCWLVEHTLCVGAGHFADGGESCRDCPVYKQQAGDEIVQLADTFNHMTERLQKSEMELRRSEERYRLLFDSDPNPVFVVGSGSQVILDANGRAAEKFGYPKEKLIGMRFAGLGDGEGARIDAAFSGSDPRTEVCSQLPRVRLKTAGGKFFWANLYFCHYTHLGRPSFIATTSDISELIEAETKLVQAGKMTTLGEMAAGVAHELNQPLNAIKIGCEFLQKTIEQQERVPDEELEELAADIGKEVDRAAGIIDHLRQFGRKSTIARHPVDINAPVRGVFSLLGQQLKVNGIELVLALEDGLPPILADNNRIEQVLLNLVVNARDAMLERREADPAAGPMVLTVKSFFQNNLVTVTVGDTGTGIPVALQGRVFEPFFTTKEVGKGTGLGLSISYGIVRDYEGRIEFDTAENGGTTFKVSFPKAPELL
jgi:PAS domain S-box-containing protein